MNISRRDQPICTERQNLRWFHPRKLDDPNQKDVCQKCLECFVACHSLRSAYLRDEESTSVEESLVSTIDPIDPLYNDWASNNEHNTATEDTTVDEEDEILQQGG